MHKVNGNDATFAKYCTWHWSDFAVCQGIISSSSMAGMDQFENAGSSTKLYCIQDKQQWNVGLQQCSDLNWISVVLVITVSRSVCLSIKILQVGWRTQSLVSKGHISLIWFRSSILQKMNWVINGRPLISHVNKNCPVYNLVRWSLDLMIFLEGKKHHRLHGFPPHILQF